MIESLQFRAIKGAHLGLFHSMNVRWLPVQAQFYHQPLQAILHPFYDMMFSVTPLSSYSTSATLYQINRLLVDKLWRAQADHEVDREEGASRPRSLTRAQRKRSRGGDQ